MSATILDTIGQTPLISISRMNRPEEAQVLFKYERYNPGGSIKDRAALYLVETAEQRGWLKPGGTLIESSSGNFGISLAMIGAAKGYRVIILVDPKTTEANLALIRGFGAEVIVVTEQDDSGSYHKTRIALANKLASEIEGAYRPDQCFNRLNQEAHYQSTAREILEQCPGRPSAFVAAVSTGGQLGGISRFLKTYAPRTQVVGVDAVGSTVFGGQANAYRTPGVGLSWTPVNLSLSNLDYAYKISDEQAFVTARAFARHEGILMGPSSGACALVALKLAQQWGPEHRIVSMVADGGDRYIQTLFNDPWMHSQGFSTTASPADIRGIARRLEPWSASPGECANEQTGLIEALQVPQATLLANAELHLSDTIQVRRPPAAAFLD
ncbi:PLP-dependent cysteine synthase family protein [Saccharibacillus deserti]|uniref:PLP-dependent cysteine synthase family protein n=1 Tax=Saccharibacillus deserti TaxID=1634444 RepID=UPI001553D6D9|nr:cysteine synthase family protein [Saccharibacillus deserti]